MVTKGNSRSEVILVASNSCWNLVNFRAPILRQLVRSGFRVIASAPVDASTPALREMGVAVEPIAVDPRGLSPLGDARLLRSYHELLRRVRPAAFLGFTVKPNIYGSLAAFACRVPVINTITGLGTGFLSGGALQSLVTILYRSALRRSRRVFFHNSDDLELFVSKRIVSPDQAAVVAGSGINLEQFAPAQARSPAHPLTFLFIGRFLKDKGAREFIEAARLMKGKGPVRFQMIGAVENHPKGVARDVVEAAAREGVVELLGTTFDVRPYIADADCVVLPSYREGLPRVLLEASAMATPVIATDVPGCRQAVNQNVTGLLCEARSADALARTLQAFIDMTPSEQVAMGERGRHKADREFSEARVVRAYLEALEEIAG